MISEGILGAIVGGSAAAFGSFVQAWFNRQNTKDRIEAENDRRHADYYLQEKVKALSELHGALEECRQEYLHALGGPHELDDERFESTILPKFEKYESAVARTSIFLDDKQREVLTDTVDQFKAINSSISIYLFAENRMSTLVDLDIEMITNKEDLTSSVESARDVLRDEISEPVKHFESD